MCECAYVCVRERVERERERDWYIPCVRDDGESVPSDGRERCVPSEGQE